MHGVVLRRSHCWLRLKNIPHRETIWSGWIFSASLTHKLSSGILATRYLGLRQYKYLFWKRLMVLINFQDCAANERESDNKTKHAGTSSKSFPFFFFQNFCTFRWILERVWAGPTAGLFCFLFCAKFPICWITASCPTVFPEISGTRRWSSSSESRRTHERPDPS